MFRAQALLQRCLLDVGQLFAWVSIFCVNVIFIDVFQEVFFVGQFSKVIRNVSCRLLRSFSYLVSEQPTSTSGDISSERWEACCPRLANPPLHNAEAFQLEATIVSCLDGVVVLVVDLSDARLSSLFAR